MRALDGDDDRVMADMADGLLKAAGIESDIANVDRDGRYET